MMTFLELNDMPIDSSDEELINLGLGIASSRIGQEELEIWIIDHVEK